jgi:hypothetical protein
MKNLAMIFSRAAVATVALLLCACVATVSGQMTIPKEVAVKSVYFVERSPKDGRDLAAIIVERMKARGLEASTGAVAPASATYVVSYIDKWQWDMRMYLWDMRIEVRDAKDHSIIGYGESAQSSLKAMGKNFADIIDIALDQLFNKK